MRDPGKAVSARTQKPCGEALYTEKRIPIPFVAALVIGVVLTWGARAQTELKSTPVTERANPPGAGSFPIVPWRNRRYEASVLGYVSTLSISECT